MKKSKLISYMYDNNLILNDTKSYSSHPSMICHWQCQVVAYVFLRMIVFFIGQFLLIIISPVEI